MPRAKPRKKSAMKTGEWKPRVMFWLLVLAVLGLGAAELRNALRRPSLHRVAGEPGTPALTLYYKGRPESRVAWLFFEPEGETGAPVCFQCIDCTPREETTGEIRWSFTGQVLYATRRRPESLDTGSLPLWAYDFEQRTLYALPELAKACPLAVQPAAEREMVALINRTGGKGRLALAWYDLGKKGDYLPAWKATRWEQALPE
jgi:hypothetical protein